VVDWGATPLSRVGVVEVVPEEVVPEADVPVVEVAVVVAADVVPLSVAVARAPKPTTAIVPARAAPVVSW
jgi:hypothetical protein